MNMGLDLQPQPAPSDRYGARRAPAKNLLYIEPVYEAQAPEEPSGLLEIWQLLKSGFPKLLGLTLVGAALGALITLQQQPIYEAHLSLEIQMPTETSIGPGAGGAAPGYSSESYLQTQVRVLQSRTLEDRTLARLRGARTWTVPQRRSLLSSLAELAGISRAVAKPAEARPPSFKLRAKAWENTQAVELICESTDADFSAQYLNTLAEEYVQSDMEARWETSERTTQWLTKQLDDLKGKLEASEQQLTAYNASAGLLFTQDQESISTEKLQQVQEELSKAQADRVVKQSEYENAQASAEEAIPQVADNERLNGYRVRLAELRRQLAELSSLYTSDHYKVVQTKAQIAELEATLKREREAVLARIHNDYLTALRREKLLTASYQAQANIVSDGAAKAVRYDILKREVETNRQVYSALLQRVKEINIASAVASSNVRVVDKALRPRNPSQPSLSSNIMKGLGGGLLLGIVVLIAADRINRSLRAPGETPFHLKVPELGVIPSCDMVSARQLKHDREVDLAPPAGEPSAERVELVTWQDSPSVLAESYRNTLASILLNSGTTPRPQVIVVTSSDGEVGKSTIVSNLGIALAEINQNVLVIDADMRKPRMHEIFGVSNTWGLSDLLRERTVLRDTPLEALARPTEVPRLHLVPSGPGTLSISNLLYSGRMSELLQRFRSEFDAILVDTPPMLYIPDARILGKLADAAILVVRAGRTTRDAALDAKERLTQDGVPLCGTILNGWDLKSKTRYGNYTYYSSGS